MMAHWITYFIYLNLLKATCTGTSNVVHRRTISTSRAGVRLSLFKSLDPLADDVSVSLQQYPRREYSNIHSTSNCASLCQLDDTCNFFHIDQKGAICFTYQLAGVAVKENGLCCFHYQFFVTCACFPFDKNIFVYYFEI